MHNNIVAWTLGSMQSIKWLTWLMWQSQHTVYLGTLYIHISIFMAFLLLFPLCSFTASYGLIKWRMMIHLCPWYQSLTSSTLIIILYQSDILFFHLFIFSFWSSTFPLFVVYLHSNTFIWCYHKVWYINYAI